MKISTRVQYAARAVFYLAAEYGKGPVALHKIAAEQGISFKYLEHIMRNLLTAGIIKSEKGKNGGFVIARRPSEITMNDIVAATDGEFCPVSCIEEPESCSRYNTCGVSSVWKSLGKVVSEHLKSVNFQDMIDNKAKRLEEGVVEKEDWNYY